MVFFRDGKDDELKWETKLSSPAKTLVDYHRSENTEFNISSLMDDMTGKDIRQIVEQLGQEEFRLRYMLTAIHRTQEQISNSFDKPAEPKRGYNALTLEHIRDVELEDEDEDDE